MYQLLGYIFYVLICVQIVRIVRQHSRMFRELKISSIFTTCKGRQKGYAST